MMTTNTPKRCLGLVGGLGVGAAIHYYRELAKAHEQQGVPMHLVMIHADMRWGMEQVRAGRKNELAEYLAGIIRSMQAAGAEVAAIPAVTPHYCARELERISPLPLVDILETTQQAALREGYHRVAVFGTRFSIETDLFGQLDRLEIVRPREAEIDFVHDTYVRIAQTGAGTEAQRLELSQLAHRLIERDRVDAILMAGTDLSVLFDETNTDFPHIDCAKEQIDAIMSRL